MCNDYPIGQEEYKYDNRSTAQAYGVGENPLNGNRAYLITILRY